MIEFAQLQETLQEKLRNEVVLSREVYKGRFPPKQAFLFGKRLLGKLFLPKNWSLVITSAKITPVFVFNFASRMKKKEIPLANK